MLFSFSIFFMFFMFLYPVFWHILGNRIEVNLSILQLDNCLNRNEKLKKMEKNTLKTKAFLNWLEKKWQSNFERIICHLAHSVSWSNDSIKGCEKLKSNWRKIKLNLSKSFCLLHFFHFSHFIVFFHVFHVFSCFFLFFMFFVNRQS